MKSLNDAYEMLGLRLEELDKRQRKLMEHAFLEDNILVPPRLYLRGMFVELHLESLNLVIKVNGVKQYFNLHAYDGAYLPFPNHQVLIYHTQEGPRINGFGENGAKIPPARYEELTLDFVNAEIKQWHFKNVTGNTIILPLPANLPDGITLKRNTRYRFRIVESMPDRFYLLDEQFTINTARQDIMADMLYKLKFKE